MDSQDVRILAVDDEKRVLQAFTLMLGDFGYDLKTATCGDEALDLIGREKFTLVFLDNFLGRERGLEVMEKMMAVDPSLYYVMITANGSTDLAVDALKRGVSDFISKPFFTADLIRSIEFVMRKRELDNQRKELMETLETKVQERTEELERTHLDVLAALAQALEARDSGTSGHCRRVAHYAKLIGEKLGMSAPDMRYLEIAALLHDVGKIGIHDVILLKPAKLSDEEWVDLKSHPAKGVEILKSLKYVQPALPGILHHHERFDGRGYPTGLAGEEIPLNSRIISVVDAWDVMRSDRPYRSALNEEEARKELFVFSGSQFDPKIVELFLDSL